jgi:Ca2+-dependent lipid-binding protein
MTKSQIEEEYVKDSLRWVDAGAGRLGRLFVEILGCDDLPNLDVGGFAGNKTDAFVSLVFEDAVVQTDVVDDTLSPRWLPWTKRAFIFHMLHSSSQLFMGVFDYDAGINPADDHDLIGRISVDLSNLRKDTVYTLNYKLCTTARMSGRKEKGSITIRLRLEIEDERKLLLSALEPPPKVYVNVKTRKEFRVVRYTCTGKYNMEKYSMKVINSYVAYRWEDACILH